MMPVLKGSSGQLRPAAVAALLPPAALSVRGRFRPFLLRVGDGALQGLYVVAFGLADDFLDGAGHGWFDLLGS
jgi:hypothetical protein